MSEKYQSRTEDRLETDETPESEYPFNSVFQTPGGIRVTWGDEQGKEHLKIFHPSGTYMEMFPDGKMASMTIGENKSYNKGGVTISVDENNDLHVSGHQKMTVGGGSHIEVQGDAGIVVGGATALVGLGDLGMAINGNGYLGVKGNMNMNVGGNMSTQVAGTNSIGTGGAMTVQAPTLSLNPSDGASGYAGV